MMMSLTGWRLQLSTISNVQQLMFGSLRSKSSHRCSSSLWACGVLMVLLALAPCLHSATEESKASPRKIAVITHLDNVNSEVTRAELGRMFMKKTTLWRNGKRCIPIDQAGTSDIRAQFYRAVLDRSVDSMKRYWMRETMTGNAKPPVSLDSSATVKKYIQKIRGGIAYIYEDEVDDSVRVLHVKDMPVFSSPDDGEDAANEDDTASGDGP